MRKTIQHLFVLLFILLSLNIVDAQIHPTFVVKLTAPVYEDSIGTLNEYDAMTFDIIIGHTNSETSGPFEFALGQYYVNVNSALGVTADYNFYIMPGSTEFSNINAVPRNPTFVSPDATSPFGASLRLNANNILGAGSGPIVSIMDPYPPYYGGTRVCTMRFKKKVGSFPILYVNMEWRTELPNPYTKVFAYIGTINTDVTNDGTYFIEPVWPVELSNFSATVNRNLVKLNWCTVAELNNAGFDIERKSSNSEDWIKAGYVNGHGTLNSPVNYTFTDKVNTGSYNYRLKQIDFNGNYEYFNLSNEVEVGLPSSFAISQNYPNPFNPTTSIDYELPLDGKVNIELYDMAGKLVANLLNEIKTAGYYKFSFNASNLSSGIYFYRISAGSFTATKKMTLIK